jgi:hypothetical protein
VEVLAVLALVGGRVLSDGVSVDRALDVGDRKRIDAAWARLNAGVTLEEDVKSVAELLAVTESSALRRVVCVESLVGQVSDLLSGSGLVGEGLGVAVRSARATSSNPENALLGVVLVNCTMLTRNNYVTTLMLVTKLQSGDLS